MALAAVAVSGTLALGFLGWRLWPAGEPSVIKETVIATAATEVAGTVGVMVATTGATITTTNGTDVAPIQELAPPESTDVSPIANPSLHRVRTTHPLDGRLMIELTNHIRIRNAVLKRREERRIEYQARLHHDEVCKAITQLREALLIERGYYEHKQRLAEVFLGLLTHPLTYRSVPAPPPLPLIVMTPLTLGGNAPTRGIPTSVKFFDEIQQPHHLRPAADRQLKPKMPSFGDAHKAELFRAIQHRAQVFPSE